MAHILSPRRPTSVGSLRLTFEYGESSIYLAKCESGESSAPVGYDLRLLTPRRSTLLELQDRYGATVYRQVLRDFVASGLDGFSVSVPAGTGATDAALVASSRRTLLGRFALNGGPA